MTSQTTGSLRLGTLEAQVMDVLWEDGAATIRDVINRLPSDPAYTTIATVLHNLARKGLVTATRQNHSTTHAASVSREAFAAAQMEQALSTSHDRAASILHFVQAMPESDRALLRKYLDSQQP